MKVELISFMGDDLTVVNAARVSYGKHSDKMTSRDIKLINFLMTNGHGTPFEHVVFQFRVTCPIFVAREWMRHRWGSYSELSMRWADVEPEFYRPEQGDPNLYENVYGVARSAYNLLLAQGTPRELARAVLPVGTYTQFYWTVNARALMNFISLRNHEAAQPEIQECAKVVEAEFALTMPHTHKAFELAERRAP